MPLDDDLTMQGGDGILIATLKDYGARLAALEGGGAALPAREAFHAIPANFSGTNIYYIGGLAVNFGALGTGTPGIDTLGANAFITNADHTVDRIGFSVVNVGAAGSVARCGIYAADPVTFYPTTLVVDGGEFDTTVAGGTGFKETVVSVQLQAGKLYWFCFLAGVASPDVKISTGSGSWMFFGYSTNLGNRQEGLTVARAYGALPATFPAGAVPSGATKAAVGVRFSA